MQWRGVGHPKKWGGGLRAAGRAGPGKHASPPWAGARRRSWPVGVVLSDMEPGGDDPQGRKLRFDPTMGSVRSPKH